MTFDELVALLKDYCQVHIFKTDFNLSYEDTKVFNGVCTDYFTITSHYADPKQIRIYEINREIDELVSIYREKITKKLEEKYRKEDDV